jgi:hypothetical protein
MGGPTIRPGTAADYGYTDTDSRRSIYVPVLRNALPEIFEVFDFADPSVVTGTRNVSTVAPQALFLMNHPWVDEQASHAARGLLALPNLDDQARLERAYRAALGRSPAPGEAAVARKFLQSMPDPGEAWTEIYHAIFASADFRYLN